MTRLLLADNDPNWLNLASNAIKRHFTDTTLTTAPSYGEARRIISSQQFDLIIIDIHLIKEKDPEDYSGIKLAKTFALNTPKIIVTNDATFNNIRRALQRSNGIPASVNVVDKTTDDDFVQLTEAIDAALNFKTSELPANDSIFAYPNIEQKCDIFVIMPFAKTFNDVYQSFQNVATSCNLHLLRGDEQISKNDVLQDIWSGIHYCEALIVDCTGKNPNVFYELGIADTLNKPVVLITQEINDIPFDIRTRRLIEYRNTPKGLQILEANLEKAIRRILNI